MANIQEILQAVLGMQQNAQANLPVIPNNGNPNGANNMPNNPVAPRPMAPMLPQRADNTPAWLHPSPAMDTIHAMLAGMGQGMPMQTMQAAVQPAIAGPVMLPVDQRRWNTPIYRAPR